MLQRHAITAIADVRSQPYGWLDHFNRENLSAELKAGRIEYVFLGDQLGARRQERECYENGIAMYERVATLPAFREGLARLRSGAAKYRLAILCAEKEPLACHRAILIARCLKKSGMPSPTFWPAAIWKTMRLPRDVWSGNWTSAARYSSRT